MIIETRTNLTDSFRLERGGQFESGFQIWSLEDVKKIDSYALMIKKEKRAYVRFSEVREPFSWSGLQSMFIHCFVGDYSMSKKLGA